MDLSLTRNKFSFRNFQVFISSSFKFRNKQSNQVSVPKFFKFRNRESEMKNINEIRREIIKNCRLPLGTVPIYQALIEAGSVAAMDIENYLRVFEKQAKDGIDFATVHAGITKRTFPLLKKRIMKCVSRGGSFMLNWMKEHQRENFLYENFERILEIAREYDVTLSLGDGLRPGCLADATDAAQIQELKILGKLAQKAREMGVQVMIEGPGHIPLNEIEKNVQLEKRYCGNAPFYVLGPLPTDIAAGYDHISGAIGGALAGWKGADFLCYVTPMEHIGLPDVDDVREGVVVTKIAAHIADIAKGNKEAILRDYKMAKSRAKVNWQGMAKYVIDRKKFLELRRKECEKNPQLKKAKYCSMCGPFCVFLSEKW
ncbi:MAG: phosphomethylpyrimidine synthase ThiC [Candidatus Nealsonbacteria bacterium CG08_land_8_20_14_0_20_38_20]|uniref:Phosphomethylpyrimidine synthase ThiC n=1 Tax=Candidatus Nealsonbacteria bacterium CG08_land_8_20_14_0_20_38_20 TaxID=1974705 RepID=A0A2H0YML3_9BACT|nr:MAG: phosphomethylpyrimidine synthase ThiC [Candidatus Nealsonbacteria bacterium CG08_land_8_20_14_0_20_38_20]